MTDNTTENPVQADINDVLDNMTTQLASQARQLAISQAQAEGPATPDVSPSDAYRRTHAKGRRPDGKNQRNV